jgi:hypothetical protein
MYTRNLPAVKMLQARKADNFNAIYEPIFLENVGVSSSQNAMGHHGLLQG